MNAGTGGVGMSEDAADGARAARVERHSIDFIPLGERHGKPWHQLPFWFSGGAVLTSVTVGFIGPSIGLGLAWSLVAVILGLAFGTVFMALHANQGPRLGIPQMIQSRAQFGYRGAIFSFILAVAIYVSFVVITALFVRDLIDDVFAVNVGKWIYFLFVAAVLVIPIYGYDIVHLFNRWAGYLSVLIFIAMTILIAMYAGSHGTVAAASHGFSWAPFLVQFAAAAGYQASYVVYTSDYTRYLPHDVSAPRLIGYVYSGATLSPLWLGCIGVIVASYVSSPDPLASLQTIGNTELSGFGTFFLIFELPVFIIVMSMCIYGAVVDAISAVDSVRRVKSTAGLRIGMAVGIGFVSALISTVLPASLIADFETLLTFMLYLLIPWTAVNLVDYYLVRRGRYSVTEIFKPDGLYGSWSWRGLTAYALGVVAMIPFYVLSFYEGPAAKALGGADISYVIGIAVGGLLYYFLARGLRGDVSAHNTPSAAVSGAET